MNLGNVMRKLAKGYTVLLKQKLQEQAAEAKKVEVGQQTIIQPPPQVITLQTSPILLPSLIFEKEKEEKEKKEEKEAYPLETELKDALEIPAFTAKAVSKIPPKEGAPEIKQIIIYPLIPRKPKKGEPVFAYAKIVWEPEKSRYVYNVIEPQLTEKIKIILSKVKEILEEKLDVDFSKLRVSEASDYLNQQFDKIVARYGYSLTEDEKLILRYYIQRDFISLGKIEPLMRDPQIEDISCDGVGINVFVFHKNPDLGSVATNIVFNDNEELDSFITRLSQLAGKSISIVQPLVDGTLPDGSRLQATLATDIARRGSNFTIRKFTEEPITPVHLLNFGTIDVRSLAYLWLAIDYGRSLLISGGTATGKTSFLNAVSLFIRPDKKIISIEDTAELRLPHPHWVPTVARSAVATGEGIGEVDMYMLLKESLRQRPDYIIVGEVRGQEAFILFQQIATGHPSLATIHAENIDKLVDRLATAPISLPKPLIASLDLIVFLARVRYQNKFVRRVVEISEMIKFHQLEDKPIVNTIFKWNPFTDKVEAVNKSILLKKIAQSTGIKEKELLEELMRRMLILDWMQGKNINDYHDIFQVLNMYYYHPNRVLTAVSGE